MTTSLTEPRMTVWPSLVLVAGCCTGGGTGFCLGGSCALTLAHGAASRMAQTAAATCRRLFMFLKPDFLGIQPFIGRGHASIVSSGRIVWAEAAICLWPDKSLRAEPSTTFDHKESIHAFPEQACDALPAADGCLGAGVRVRRTGSSAATARSAAAKAAAAGASSAGPGAATGRCNQHGSRLGQFLRHGSRQE